MSRFPTAAISAPGPGWHPQAMSRRESGGPTAPDTAPRGSNGLSSRRPGRRHERRAAISQRSTRASRDDEDRTRLPSRWPIRSSRSPGTSSPLAPSMRIQVPGTSSNVTIRRLNEAAPEADRGPRLRGHHLLQRRIDRPARPLFGRQKQGLVCRARVCVGPERHFTPAGCRGSLTRHRGSASLTAVEGRRVRESPCGRGPYAHV